MNTRDDSDERLQPPIQLPITPAAFTAYKSSVEGKFDLLGQEMRRVASGYDAHSAEYARVGAAIVGLETGLAKTTTLAAELGKSSMRTEATLARVEATQHAQGLILNRLLESDGRSSAEIDAIKAEVEREKARVSAVERRAALDRVKLQEAIDAVSAEPRPRLESRPDFDGMTETGKMAAMTAQHAELIVARERIRTLEERNVELREAAKERADDEREERREKRAFRLEGWRLWVTVIVAVVGVATAFVSGRSSKPDHKPIPYAVPAASKHAEE